jgi:tetratricopeptide (TPR) repeat protein
VRHTQREKARLVEQPPVNLAAYQANLRGRYFLNRATEATVRQAIEWFREAVEADPAYAQAWVGLAEANAVLPIFSSTLVPETCAETRMAAGRALALDPGLGEAHAALGLAAQQEWYWDEAEAEYRLALGLAPGYATAHHWYGGLLTIRGRMGEALAALHRALELDPVSLPVHLSLGIAFLVDRRFDDATEILRKAIEMDPGFIGAHSILAAVHICRGRHEDALAEWEAVSRLSSEILPPRLVVQYRRGYASGGERGLWEAYLEGSRPGAALHDIGTVRAYAQLGRIDEAFTWIEKLLSERRALAPLIPGDPLVAPLHSDPRWKMVLERLGLSDEGQA